MKFSYSLQFNTVPEWTEDYLSYGQLKKAIHDTETAKLEEAKGVENKIPLDNEINGTATSVQMSSRSVQLESEFFTLFQSDARRVAAAFTAKKLSSNAKFEEFLESVSAKSNNSSEVSVNKIEVWTGDENSLEKRRASLEESFNSVYLNLHDLHDFLDLNYTGYVRVVKNYGKYLHPTTQAKRHMLNKIDMILPIAELSELQNKMGQVEEVYARVMCDGSITQARSALHLLLRDRVASIRQNGAASPVTSDIMKSAPILPTNTKDITPVGASVKVSSPAVYFTTYRIASLIGCTLLFAGILALPEKWMGDITGAKQRCLAILLSCTALWITEAIPLYVTALLIPALITILQVIVDVKVKTAGDAAKSIFGSMFTDMVFLLLGGFSIAAVLQKYGITRTAAVFILKRFGKTPASTLLTIMIVTVISSAFISNVAAPVLCFGLIQPILNGLDHSSPFAKALILGIAFAANIGGLASPIASPQSVVGSNKLSEFISFAGWITISAPICIFSTIFCWFWLLRMYRSREVLNFKEIFAVKGGEKSASPGQTIYILAVFAITIVLWVSAASLEKTVGPMGITAVFPILAYFGAGLLGKDDFNGFTWNVVFLAIGGTALGKGLFYSGLLEAIGDIITYFIGSLGYLPVMMIFCGILLFITTFVSHSVGALVFLPIIISFATGKDSSLSIVNAACLTLTACFTCSAGMAMPISGFPNMTAASQQDRNGRNYVTTADFAKGGVIPSIIFALSIVSSVYLLGPLMINPNGQSKQMDFETDSNDNEPSEMIQIIPNTTYAEEINYPTSPNAQIMQNGTKSVSNVRLSTEQQAALEEPDEKDILELLQQMDDFEPIIPEALTDYYMTKNGVECDDPRLKKMIALVTQKVISDIAMDAMQFSRMRQSSTSAGSSEAARKAASLKQKQTLTMDDLSAALSEHGINIRKPPYHL